MTLRATLRRHRRRLIREARRALRRRMRKTLRALAAHARPTPTRTKRRTHAKAAATGRTARTARLTTGTGPRAASMKQRVKRTRGGKFNGSTADRRKAVSAAAKKLAAKQIAAEARQAEKFRRTLAAGDQRVARVSKRVQSADAHLNRAFGHDDTPA